MSNAIRHTEGVNVSGIDHLTEFLQRDVNDPMYSYTPGAYQLSVAMTEDRRRSAARNYIVDTIAAGYPLTLSTHSLASHILFDRSSSVPRAVGVEYMVGEALYGADPRFNVSQTGQVKTVSASKEVIVSGGVFNTPQLLKLSGVGPREELESFGIDVIVDSPSVVCSIFSCFVVTCFLIPWRCAGLRDRFLPTERWSTDLHRFSY